MPRICYFISLFLLNGAFAQAEIFRCSACIAVKGSGDCIPQTYDIEVIENEDCPVAMGSAKIGEFNSKETYLIAASLKLETTPLYSIAFGYKSNEHHGFDVFSVTDAFTDRKNHLYLVDTNRTKIARAECKVEKVD